MKPKYHTFLKLTFILGMFFCFSTAFSQDSQSNMVQDSLGVNTPKAIPTIHVIQWIGSKNLQIKKIERELNNNHIITKLDTVLPEFKKNIDKQQTYAVEFIKANPNSQKIDNLYSKWFNYATTLKKWLADLNDEEIKLIQIAQDVDFDEKTIELTYTNAQIEGVPPELLNNIKELWDKIKGLRSRIYKQSNQMLRLEANLDNLGIDIDQTMNDLLSLKDAEVYDILYQRHPAIWNLSFQKPTFQNPIDKEESIVGNLKSVVKYLKENISRLVIYFILCLLLFGLIRHLKKAYTKYPYHAPNKNLDIAKNVISEYYIACTFLLSFTLFHILFLDSPKLLSIFISLLLLIAVSEILKTSLAPKFKYLPYALICFFIIDSIKTFVWFQSLSYRVYLIIEALLVVICLYYFTHPYLKIRKLEVSKLSKFFIKLTPVLYVLTVISIISNLLGYTNLTDLSLKLCTKSGALTMMIYAFLLAVQGVSIGVIHNRFSVKSFVDYEKKQFIEIKLLRNVRIVVFFLWTFFFLAMLGALKPLFTFLGDIFSESYTVGSLTFTFGGIVGFILILSISFLVTRFISFIINDGEGVLKPLNLPKGIPAAISLVIRYFILGFGFILAISSLGISLSKFNLMAGALGVGIGLGLQSIVSNFFSGLILVFERPILPGDTVEVNNLLGTVSRIGIRSSNIRTFDGAEVIVPNNNLISNELINWTLSDSIKRVEIPIGTSYDSDPNQVIDILKEIADQTPEVLKNPPPMALFMEFGDSSLNFVLRFWIAYEGSLQAQSDVSIAIYNKFKEANIEIPFPQRDIFIKNLPQKKEENDI
ncbi:mechanosensitive ion channel [Mangrovimonas sp. AS39]|uniref:mechanosensitive ion channel family protein n=1 Tax=Mangrovimonas futianensis TaxID=2895523 RepID=UPI001E36CB15|nr:mechanosensitive ion channel domain-containing protein [Mangrovimonas futianensis]MCF1191332.1 mechanosensitive ion channel [Mangrovimonas futianensis]MCF1195027.1 mechanosensitive ion channel [Mangrovimonas futianensis]